MPKKPYTFSISADKGTTHIGNHPITVIAETAAEALKKAKRNFNVSPSFKDFKIGSIKNITKK